VISTWEEVPAAVMSKCFKKVGMYPVENLSAEEDDDLFEAKELMDILELLSHISPGLDCQHSMMRLRPLSYQWIPHFGIGEKSYDKKLLLRLPRKSRCAR